jgi:hypothetical protein
LAPFQLGLQLLASSVDVDGREALVPPVAADSAEPKASQAGMGGLIAAEAAVKTGVTAAEHRAAMIAGWVAYS